MARFQKGVSGNPAGRPRGISTAARLRKQFETEAREIIAQVIAAAKKGDTTARRLCLERLVPPLKATGRFIKLPTLNPEDNLTTQGAAVMGALATGDITPDEAQALMDVIAHQARLVEAEELEARLAALETRINGT